MFVKPDFFTYKAYVNLLTDKFILFQRFCSSEVLKNVLITNRRHWLNVKFMIGTWAGPKTSPWTQLRQTTHISPRSTFRTKTSSNRPKTSHMKRRSRFASRRTWMRRNCWRTPSSRSPSAGRRTTASSAGPRRPPTIQQSSNVSPNLMATSTMTHVSDTWIYTFISKCFFLFGMLWKMCLLIKDEKFLYDVFCCVCLFRNFSGSYVFPINTFTQELGSQFLWVFFVIPFGAWSNAGISRRMEGHGPSGYMKLVRIK